MKYGTARFVYGLSTVVIFICSVGVLLAPQSATPPANFKDFVRLYAVNALVAVFPFALSIFCWKRYQHWNKEAKIER